MLDNFKVFTLSVAAALLLGSAANASNLVTDGQFTNVNTSLNVGGTISTYWQPGTSGVPSSTCAGNGLLHCWSTPSTTGNPNTTNSNTNFLYLSGTGNGIVCQSAVTPIASCPNNSQQQNQFQIWNNTVAGANGNAKSIPNPPSGGNFIVADGGFSYVIPISQEITGLTVGDKYAVTFDQAAGQQAGYGCAGGVYTPENCTTDQWYVNLGGTFNTAYNGTADPANGQVPTIAPFTGGTTLSSTLMSVPEDGFVGWTQQTLIFTANNASEVLSFLADGGPNGEPPVVLLADVAMVQYAPEPSSFAILGVGLVGLGLLRLRFRERS